MKTCDILHCHQKVARSGLCNKHSIDKYIWGEVIAGPGPNAGDKTQGTCRIHGCRNKTLTHGLCRMHSTQVNAGIRPTTKTQTWAKRPCRVEGCHRDGNTGRGYCGAHYERYRTYGILNDVPTANIYLKDLKGITAPDAQP